MFNVYVQTYGMVDLPPAFYIHLRPEVPYFITVSAFSRHNLFGFPSNPNFWPIGQAWKKKIAGKLL